KELRRFEGNPAFLSAAFSPDGRRFLLPGLDGVLRRWDLDGGAVKDLTPLPGYAADQGVCAAPAPGGNSVAAGWADGRVVVWGLPSGKKLHEWHLPGPVHGVPFASDGRHLATANGNGTIYVLRLAPPPAK